MSVATGREKEAEIMSLDSDIVGAIVEFAGKRHRVAALAMAPGGLGFQALLEAVDGGDLHHVNLSSALVRVVEYAPRPGQVAAIRIEAERHAAARAGRQQNELSDRLTVVVGQLEAATRERDELRETIYVLEQRLAQQLKHRGPTPADRADERDRRGG